MKIYNSIIDLIGNTPLIKINKLNTTNSTILAKVEFFNPAGSIKDRVALNMIKEAQNKNMITPNKTTIIEPTSGNTGIGLALVCRALGYKLILTMPESMSKERRSILSAYGAELVLTESKKGMQGAIDKAIELNKQIKDSYIPQQFNNPFNPETHYNTTAQEIWKDTNGQIDILIAGIGTGGTLSGCARRLKELNKDIMVVGFEPASSPVITENHAGQHKIQGIGANFIPKNLDLKLVDKIITIEDKEAIDYTKKLATEEGIFAGISSGAAICAALKIAKDFKNKTIVTILPDSGMRYLSEEIF